jgi:hypothetical protein
MPQADLMKRFTETTLETMFWVSGANVCVETNCQTVLDQLERALTPGTRSALDAPDFVLRIVAESEEDFELGPASPVHHLSHDGLSFISLGQKSFFVCDRQAGRAICFISLNLATDDGQFSQQFLPALVSLLKESIETLS